ncbi:UxaA family hydrolase [Flavitalea antarctica]
MAEFIQIDRNDNVLVALKDLRKGRVVVVKGEQLTLQEDVPAKHKFFVSDLSPMDHIIMYGVLVGKAQVPISKGMLMTTVNTKHATEKYSFRSANFTWTAPDVSKFKGRTFNGYERGDGSVGTANYWLFIPTVFCENRNLDVIREALQNELGYGASDKYRKEVRFLVEQLSVNKGEVTEPKSFSLPADRVFRNIDGIKFLNHSGGCGGTRQDAATLSKLLAAYADHPNVAGITVLSLGCQHLQVEQLLFDIKERNPSYDKPTFVFEQQMESSEEALIIGAIRKTFEGLIQANTIERKPFPLTRLSIGVKCGGSDGFSGISANPAVGHAADILVALGGKVLLAEFPELCGAEQGIIDRCKNEQVASRFIELMQEYDALAHLVGSGFEANPSPGNIKDGLITDAIKSTGAAKKGGTSAIVDVLDYTEKANKPGLSLVCTPGNDVEATTGKAASGATLILFTTGLGTPTGNPVAPTIKISTNSLLAKRISDIIDIDTGDIINGDKTIEQMGEEIFEYCIQAASGLVVPKAVELNQDDFIPWKRGVSL